MQRFKGDAVLSTYRAEIRLLTCVLVEVHRPRLRRLRRTMLPISLKPGRPLRQHEPCDGHTDWLGTHGRTSGFLIGAIR